MGLFLSITGSQQVWNREARREPSFLHLPHSSAHPSGAALHVVITAPDSSGVLLWFSWDPSCLFSAAAKAIFLKHTEIVEAPLPSHCAWGEGPMPECHNCPGPAIITSLLCPPGSLLPVLGPERPPPTQVIPPGPSHLGTQSGLGSCFHPGVPVRRTLPSRLCSLRLIHAFGSQLRCHLLRPRSKGP